MAWMTVLRSGLGNLRVHSGEVLDEQPDHGQAAPCIAVVLDGAGNQLVVVGAREAVLWYERDLHPFVKVWLASYWGDEDYSDCPTVKEALAAGYDPA